MALYAVSRGFFLTDCLAPFPGARIKKGPPSPGLHLILLLQLHRVPFGSASSIILSPDELWSSILLLPRQIVLGFLTKGLGFVSHLVDDFFFCFFFFFFEKEPTLRN